MSGTEQRFGLKVTSWSGWSTLLTLAIDRGLQELYRWSSLEKPFFLQRYRKHRYRASAVEIWATEGIATLHLSLLADLGNLWKRVTLLRRYENAGQGPNAEKGKVLVVNTRSKVSIRFHYNQAVPVVLCTAHEKRGDLGLTMPCSVCLSIHSFRR